MIMEGKNLQEILKKRGITQNQVAELLGVTRQTVSAMFHASSVKSTTLEKIAKNFGIEISELFGEKTDLTELKEELGMLRKKITELEDQVKEKDATINRLIGIIEKIN